MKNNDPLVSVQGQNEEQRPSRLSTRSKSRTMTLSSQYKVKIKNNDPLVSVQDQFNPNFTSFSSQYKVKIKNNDPLISVQGQFKVRDPLVSVQGLDLYLCIYFIVFYFYNWMKLVFVCLLIFYSDNLNFKSSDHLVKFKYGGAAVNSQFRPDK